MKGRLPCFDAFCLFCEISPESHNHYVSQVAEEQKTQIARQTDRKKARENQEGIQDMEWCCGNGSLMEEQAKEELEVLEAQYPNHFECLKLELKSFIFQLQTQKQETQLIPGNNYCSAFLSSMVDTQESTSLEQAQQRKKSNCSCEAALEDRMVMEGKTDEDSQFPSSKSYKVVRKYTGRKSKRRDRVDVVLERAQACLKKIKHFKTTLLSSS